MTFDPIGWLDVPGMRAAFLFVLALGLFLHLEPRPRELDGMVRAGAPEPAMPEASPAPVPLPPSAGLRSSARIAPAPLPVTRVEVAIARTRTQLARHGIKTPAMLDLLAANSDRRAWQQAKPDFEEAVRRKDLPGAISLLKKALVAVDPANAMLRRELLAMLVPLQLAVGEIADAEASTRDLTAVCEKIANLWVAELQANPDLARRYRLDPTANTRAPAAEEISRLFKVFEKQAKESGSPMRPSQAQLTAIRERARTLRREGRIPEEMLQAIEKGAP